MKSSENQGQGAGAPAQSRQVRSRFTGSCRSIDDTSVYVVTLALYGDQVSVTGATAE